MRGETGRGRRERGESGEGKRVGVRLFLYFIEITCVGWFGLYILVIEIADVMNFTKKSVWGGFFVVLMGVGSFRAVATPVSLNIGEANGYNLMVSGNATLSGSDIEGRAAVGGNATFAGYSVGTAISAGWTPLGGALVVGGNLSAVGGDVTRGSIYVGGSYSGPSTYTLNSSAGSVTQANMGSGVPVNFSLAMNGLAAKSVSYGAEAETGSSILAWSTMTLWGASRNVNVFNMTAGELAGASGLVLAVPAGSRVLVNVSGTSANFSSKGLYGFVAENTLFNFYQATDLTMGAIGVVGSILAPKANVNFVSGQMNGQLVAKTFTGAGELHNYGFNNQVVVSAPEVGETGWLMAIGVGACLVAETVRRGRLGKVS